MQTNIKLLQRLQHPVKVLCARAIVRVDTGFRRRRLDSCDVDHLQSQWVDLIERHSVEPMAVHHVLAVPGFRFLGAQVDSWRS